MSSSVSRDRCHDRSYRHRCRGHGPFRRVLRRRSGRARPGAIWRTRNRTTYRDRNRIERMFNQLKQARPIAICYDRTAASFLGVLCLATSRLWLKDCVNRAWSSRNRRRPP
ncbi:MAG: transposase [Rhizobiales bacterium]|nr:transposase [Hyphomicrobiales bacterium]